MTTGEIARPIREILWRHAPEFLDAKVEILATDIARYIEQLVERNRANVEKPWSDVDTADPGLH
jgi:hypothetical protein